MIDDIYHMAVKTLTAHLSQAGTAFEEDDGDVVFHGHRLALSVMFDAFDKQSDQIIAPLEIEIHLDGDDGSRFHVGMLGIGQTESEAVAAAIHEWHLLAAAPLLAALGAAAAPRRQTAESTTIAGWKVFPGRAGIRGSVPPGLQAGGNFYGNLLDGLRKTITQWPPPEPFALRSVFVMANRVEQQLELQAAVDGFVSESLTADLSALAWPTSRQAYLYKQLFVVRGGSEN